MGILSLENETLELEKFFFRHEKTYFAVAIGCLCGTAALRESLKADASSSHISRGDCSFGFAKTKKLKALVLNRPFNYVARKLVLRLLAGRDGAHGTPRPELTRQLRAG